ncbi:MAG: DUF2179 domain-containing protein [Deltaproteobacteria bacterium]|nr:DUF2179 domain-containing protein [Deltaproteobacteria bacterium]
MDIEPILNSPLFTWLILPLLIFSARILDVSIGTIRIIYISKGMKFLAPIFGFFEVLIWLLAVVQIIKNMTNPVYYIAYASGFATGNYVGMVIEERVAVGKVILRIITQQVAGELLSFLRSAGYGITTVDAEGGRGPVKIIFMVLNRRDLERTICEVRHFNPKAFFSVEDVRMVREGIFPPSKTLPIFQRFLRKGK